MGSWVRLASLVAATVVLACTSDDTFECQTDEQCAGADAMCQPTGYCSFPDPACESGQRYGGLAGGLSDQCVVDDGMPSSGSDATAASASASSSGSDATAAGSEGASQSETTGSGSETGATSTGTSPGCWLEDFEEDLLGSTWEAWVDAGVEASMGTGDAQIDLADTPGYGGIRSMFTLDVTGATTTWIFDRIPELDQDEVYEVLLVGAQGAVRVEIGFSFITGYWDTSTDEPNQLFSEPAPEGELLLVQLVHTGTSLSLSVVDEDDQPTEIITFDPPAVWDPTEQAIEFRAGANLADNLPGTLRTDLVSVCQ